MHVRKLATVIAASITIGQFAIDPARAENKMGYQLLSQQAAAQLPHNGGSLGMDIERSQQITDDGMTFDIIRVKAIRRSSPAAQAGFTVGDQVIAVDGHVFGDLAAFAQYVGSMQPGTRATVDFIPANGGPAQAQRVAITIGAASGKPQPLSSSGIPTETKIAIGVGAAALLGCYELGCFSHHPAATDTRSQQRQ